jgi:hypothetical protein
MTIFLFLKKNCMLLDYGYFGIFTITLVITDLFGDIYVYSMFCEQ